MGKQCRDGFGNARPYLSEHTMVTEVLQFLLFSIPQCLSHPVVVSTLPSPTPDTATQFSRLSSHMHRNCCDCERKVSVMYIAMYGQQSPAER